MCQAKTSVYFSSVLIWTLLSSLTFGFCSIWSLHFVAMLACELDLPIGINVPLTILSSVLAVLFTFAALASDLLWETYRQGRRKKHRARNIGKNEGTSDGDTDPGLWANGFKPRFDFSEREGDKSGDEEISERVGLLEDHSPEGGVDPPSRTTGGSDSPPIPMNEASGRDPSQKMFAPPPATSAQETSRPSGNLSDSTRSSSFKSAHTSHGLASMIKLAHRSTSPTKNAFVALLDALYLGFTRRNIVKAFSWSLAVSGMHYVGIAALRIPEGHYILNPFLVVLSSMISWAVCLIGVILMSHIETHLAQQFLFAVVASTGVAAMHFTGLLFS